MPYDAKTETPIDWVWGVGFEGRAVRPFGRTAPGTGTGTGTGTGGGGAVLGFNIALADRRLEANIVTAVGTTVGDITFGTDTHNLYVWDGTNWQTYHNS